MDEPVNEPRPSGLRIGDEERSAAMKALDAHLEAGRLDAVEYGERSATAATARTVDDLRPLFTDLPQPHPPQLFAPDATAVAAVDAAAVPATTREPGALARWGPRLVPVLPLVALVLAVTIGGPHAWLFFMLIPLGGMLFGRTRRHHRGGHGGGHDGQGG